MSPAAPTDPPRARPEPARPEPTCPEPACPKPGLGGLGDPAAARRPRGCELPSWAWDCPRCHGAGWLRGDWLDTSKGRARRLVKCPCGIARRGEIQDLD